MNTDLFFIHPTFSLAMQLLAYGSFSASVLLLMLRSRWSLLFGGSFLATVDPRFATDLGGINPSILSLYAWAAMWGLWCHATARRRGIDTFRFIGANRLGVLLAVVALLLGASLAFDVAIAVKSFVLIFLPYVVLLPFGMVLAGRSQTGNAEKLLFLRGLQTGYAAYIVLVQVYAPGEVTGALGDISVSATIVAIMCAYGMLLSVHLLHARHGRFGAAFDLALLAFFSISAVQTLSRGPLLAILLTVPLQLWLLHGSRLRRNPAAVAGFAGLLVVLLALVAANAGYVLEKRNIEADTGSSVLSSASSQFMSSRYKYILEVVDFDAIPVSDLVFGHGLGASESISRSLGIYRIESFWLEAAYDIGLVGIGLLFVALARNAAALARADTPDAPRFGALYLSLFLFTLFLSPSSFGWFLQGHTGFIYAALLMLACRPAPPARRPTDSEALTPVSAGKAPIPARGSA